MADNIKRPEMIAEDKLDIFYNLFFGSYLAQTYIDKKTQKEQFSPVRNNNNLPIEYSDQTVVKSHILKHFQGHNRNGIYFIKKPDNKVKCIVFDLDGKNQKDFDFSDLCDESRKIISALAKYNIPGYAEMSKSGQGFHIWVFFDDWVLMSDVRIVINFILSEYFLTNSKYFENQDGLYPKQDNLVPDDISSIGSLVSLPLNGKYTPSGKTWFYDLTDGFKKIDDIWTFFKEIKKVSINILQDIITVNDLKKPISSLKISQNNSPKNNNIKRNIIPPCIQQMKVLKGSGYGHDTLFVLVVFCVNNLSMSEDDIIDWCIDKYYDKPSDDKTLFEERESIRTIYKEVIKKKHEDRNGQGYTIGCIDPNSNLSRIIKKHFDATGEKWCPYDDDIKKKKCPFFNFDAQKTFVLVNLFEILPRDVPPLGTDFDDFYRELSKFSDLIVDFYVDKIAKIYKVRKSAIKDYIDTIKRQIISQMGGGKNLKPVHEIIKAWADKHYEFVYKEDDHLFSMVYNSLIKMSFFCQNLNKELRESIQANGQECNPPIADSSFDLMKIYRLFSEIAPSVFAEYRKVLLFKYDLQPGDKSLMRNEEYSYYASHLSKLLFQELRRLDEDKCITSDSIYRFASTAASDRSNSNKFRRIYNLSCYYRNSEEIEICISPMVFTELNMPKFVERHMNYKSIGQRIIELNLGVYERIYVECSRVLAIKLNLKNILEFSDIDEEEYLSSIPEISKERDITESRDIYDSSSDLSSVPF